MLDEDISRIPARDSATESRNSNLDLNEDNQDDENNGESAISILGSMVKDEKDKDPNMDPATHLKDVSTEGFTETGDDKLLDEINSTFLKMSEESEGGEAVGWDEPTIKMKIEYEKLHKLFTQSRKNEQGLFNKCRQLATELSANASKVHTALTLSQQDRITIGSLKKEVKKAWKMVEVGNEKEARAKEAIARLKIEMESLKKAAGAPTDGPESTSSMGGYAKIIEDYMTLEQTIARMQREKDELLNQYDIAMADRKVLENEAEDLQIKIKAFVTERAAMEEDMQDLKSLLSSKKMETDREFRAREKLEVSLRLANDIINKKESEYNSKASEVKGLNDAITRLENQLRDEKIKLEKEIKENDILAGKLMRIQTEYNTQVLQTDQLIEENQTKSNEIKTWEDEVKRCKEENKNIARLKDGVQKRIVVLEDAKIGAYQELESLKSLNHSLTHELDAVKKQLDNCIKQIEALTRDRDVAQKNFIKATSATQKQLNIVKLTDQSKRTLDQEILGYKDEASKMRKLIFSLEKDRDRYINESIKTQKEYAEKDEEVKIKEMLIFDSRKKISELEKKLKEQQSLYENVRADRNLYSKNLIESQDEITEMKRKLRIMGHQIEQLKEEIANKDADVAKSNFEHAKLEKEKEALAAQITKLQQQYEESQLVIQNREAEESKLRHIIAEADMDKAKKRKEYDSVVQERDILGTQLIRRNEELALLYEKIKIQMSTLNKGELQFRERVEDIRVLKLEIKKLRREKAILQTETQNVDGLREEIFRLQREVLKERTRVKVLEEELESPMNIHRWRKLSGSDPTTFELITKIQTLQRRLITKTEEVVERDLIIAQKEKLYKEVKTILQRQPGPEIAEELRIVREAVKSKMRECKSLASELNMYHSQVNEYKYEIDRLNHELQDIKKKYYEQKKRDREDKLLRRALLEQHHQHHASSEDSLTKLPSQSHRLPVPTEASYIVSSPSKGGGFRIALPSAPPSSGSLPSLKPHLPNGPKFSGGGFNMSMGPLQSVHHHTAPHTAIPRTATMGVEEVAGLVEPQSETGAGGITENESNNGVVPEPTAVS